VDEAPLEWGRFVLALPSRAMERAAENQAWTFQWQGYDVVAFPAGPTPAFLRARVPEVADWTAHLFLRDRAPVGVALAPKGAAAGAPWMAVVFDELAVPVGVPDDVATDWTVKHDDPQ